jgi:carbon-monoxide dehydrogenase large subunit
VVFTHTSPIGAYRGAGRPEANYFMERLIDTAAREMGIDQLRRCGSAISSRPEEMPYKTASGVTYDSGEFTGCSTRRWSWPTYDGFAASARRRAKSAASCGARHRRLSRSDGAAVTNEMGGSRFEPERRRHDHHRHARLRPGPLVGFRPGAVRPSSAFRSTEDQARSRATATC